jgi:hypothetical protein
MQPTTINFTTPSSGIHDVATFVALAAIAVTILVHLMVAAALMTDSVATQRRGTSLFFFGPMGWTFIGLMTGLLGLAAYWLMHHSSLRVSTPTPQPETAPPASADERLARLVKT